MSGYLDNTDSLAGLSCSNTEIAKWNGSAWACAADANDDTQDLSLTTNTLALVNGGSVDLSGYLDNTDTLADLSCSNGQVAQWNGSAWLCAAAGVDTDDQTLSIDGSNNLIIADGNQVSLAAYLDDTTLDEAAVDAFVANNGYLTSFTEVDGSTTNELQAISVSSNILSISGDASTVDLSGYLDNTDSQALSLTTNTLALVNGGSVDLSGYLDNTDAQDLTLSANTLALTNDGTTVDLSGYLDNTDSLAGLSCSNTEIAKWNGSAWACAADANDDTQDLSLTTNTLALVNGGSVDLSGYLDNTDTLADLSCSNGQVAQWNGSAWLCAAAGVDTDDQTLSIDGSNNLIIADGNQVSLAAYLDDTTLDEAAVDAFVANNGYLTSFTEVDGSTTNELQAISVSSNILSISGDASTVDLSGYLDNTDSQALNSTTPSIRPYGPCRPAARYSGPIFGAR